MLVKWIVATVPSNQRQAFAGSQQAWAPLAHCEGFLGQVGGWDQNGRGCLLGLWRDDRTYNRFMTLIHDAILADSEGPPPFSRLDITTSASILRLPGAAPDAATALFDARWMRVQDCTIAPDQTTTFVAQVLRSRPARLAAVQAFCAGTVSAGEHHRFFNTTLWSAADAPAGPLPTIRSSQAPNAQVTELIEYRVALEPSWRILPPPERATALK